jgi:hypothetical protein
MALFAFTTVPFPAADVFNPRRSKSANLSLSFLPYLHSEKLDFLDQIIG